MPVFAQTDTLPKADTLRNIDLSEVVVRPERSYLETQTDRTVYHIGEDIASKSKTLGQTLENIPTVEVSQQGQIAIRGDRRIQFYINGRPSRRSPASISQIPADLIQKVEIITAPSAKYDPEGTAGIINIVYRKSKRRNLKSTLKATGGVPQNIQLGILNSFKPGKFNFNLNGNYTQREISSRRRIQTWQKSQDKNVQVYENQLESRYNGDSQDGNFSIGWEPDSMQTFELTGDYSRWFDLEKNRDILRDFVNNPLLLRNEIGELENEYSLGFSWQMDVPSFGELTASLGWLGEQEEDFQAFNLDNVAVANTLLAQGVNATKTEEKQSFMDGSLTFAPAIWAKANLESGLAFQQVRYDVLQQLQPYEPTLTLPDNDFFITQRKGAAYLIAAPEWGRWKVEAGVRVEYFASNSRQESLDSNFQTELSQVFPSTNLKYAWGKGKNGSLGLQYSRRINRPGFFDLNPYIDYTEPLNLNSGNPYLKPEAADVLELASVFEKNTFQSSLKFFGKRTRNVIQRVTVRNGTGTFTTTRNLDRATDAGIEWSIGFKPFPWWDCNQTATCLMRWFAGQPNIPVVYNGKLTWSFRTQQTFEFDKIKVQFIGFYRAPAFSAQARQVRQFYLNTALFYTLNERLNFNCSLSDIFDTREFEGMVEGGDFQVKNKNKFQSRAFLAGLSYTLTN